MKKSGLTNFFANRKWNDLTMIARSGPILLAAQLTLCPCASAQGHLTPEEGILNKRGFEWEYAKTLRDVLMKDAADHYVARMVCLPAFEPEWVVTVVREDAGDFDTPRTYYVESVVAITKLSRPKDSQRMGVRRSRAPLDPETAEALNTTWRQMLRRTRYPRRPRIGADGVGYHFSRSLALIDRGQNDPLAGWEQGTIWSPVENSPCGELVAIGERLKEYAQAGPDERDRLRKEIRVNVDKLAARFNRPERDDQSSILSSFND